MHIVVPRENNPKEPRIALIPEHGKKFVEFGIDVSVETGLGESLHIPDDIYKQVGVSIVNDRRALIQKADMILRINKPEPSDIEFMKTGAISISLLDPFNEKDLVRQFEKKGISAVSLEMIPRTTKAQKMDVLSSQASLAGYIAVITAAERITKILPMMMTPSGTIKPAKVFIIGAGVAGLQAIATAKRLGAQVEAFDTRPVVEEQVQSLGAKFVKVDLGETGQTKDGYAKKLTEEQLQKQREKMAEVCSYSDIVITTAKLFGRKAPIIITKDMIKNMKPGSVIVDLAVDNGGNVEGAKLDEEVDIKGVRIIGVGNLPGKAALDASQMFSSNLTHFITDYWDKENKTFNLDLEDEIIKGCLITHQKQIVNETIRNHYTA